MVKIRDRKTGRYIHTWGWQGFDKDEHQWERCDHCGLWRDNSDSDTPRRKGPEKTWSSFSDVGSIIYDKSWEGKE